MDFLRRPGDFIGFPRIPPMAPLAPFGGALTPFGAPSFRDRVERSDPAALARLSLPRRTTDSTKSVSRALYGQDARRELNQQLHNVVARRGMCRRVHVLGVPEVLESALGRFEPLSCFRRWVTRDPKKVNLVR